MEISIVEIIQSMLAPGIMISACGLLLLGMNNKYSMVINRIRLLDDEKRRLSVHEKELEFSDEEETRLKSVDMQISKLHYRIKLVRNAVFLYSLAVALFVIASLTIGLLFVKDQNRGDISYVPLAIFLLGMLSVLIGVVFAGKEVWKGYEIVSIEIKEQ
jgi:hypothetical protein